MHAYEAIRSLALKDYHKRVREAHILRDHRSAASGKLRLLFKDSSFLDIYLSPSGKYSYHWERRMLDGTVFRFDNAPHHPHIGIEHLHKGTEEAIVHYSINADPVEAFHEVMSFIERYFTDKERKS